MNRYSDLNAADIDHVAEPVVRDCAQPVSPEVGKKVRDYLRHLSDTCKECFRRSPYNCDRCVIQDAGILLQELESEASKGRTIMHSEGDSPDKVLEASLAAEFEEYLRCMGEWLPQQELYDIAYAKTTDNVIVGNALRRMKASRRGKKGAREYKYRAR